MMLPAPAAVHAAVRATWPPFAVRPVGPFLIRDGQGGGSRVCAATVTGPFAVDDLPLAEAAMRDLGQDLLFMVRDGEDALDALLATRGYAVKDPVVGYAASVGVMTQDRPSEVAPFWPPLAAQREIWAEAGIGPERIAIMERAVGAKTALLARSGDAPAGAAFVACDGSIAMLHALEVLPNHRRQGVGAHLLGAAAFWAAAQGAAYLTLVVTEANATARRLYEAQGMVPVARYHYRIRQI